MVLQFEDLGNTMSEGIEICCSYGIGTFLLLPALPHPFIGIMMPLTEAGAPA